MIKIVNRQDLAKPLHSSWRSSKRVQEASAPFAEIHLRVEHRRCRHSRFVVVLVVEVLVIVVVDVDASAASKPTTTLAVQCSKR